MCSVCPHPAIDYSLHQGILVLLFVSHVWRFAGPHLNHIEIQLSWQPSRWLDSHDSASLNGQLSLPVRVLAVRSRESALFSPTSLVST